MEFKPCPFCGRKAELYIKRYKFGVTCSNPDCHVSPYLSTQISQMLAIKLWNTRKGEPDGQA